LHIYVLGLEDLDGGEGTIKFKEFMDDGDYEVIEKSSIIRV
jgi:hypothetical protein